MYQTLPFSLTALLRLCCPCGDMLGVCRCGRALPLSSDQRVLLCA